MEKVKLTREQAEEIERYKKNGDEQIDYMIDGHIYDKRPDLKISTLKTSELARALYIGYEVKETFEVGDWVYVEVPKKELPNVFKVMIAERYSVKLDRLYGNHKKSDIRHATAEEIAEEKQRRWWAKHGRDVWELRENDLLYYDGEFKEVEEVSEFGAIILSSERVYFPLETIKSKYSIACFAEDRKDVK